MKLNLFFSHADGGWVETTPGVVFRRTIVRKDKYRQASIPEVFEAATPGVKWVPTGPTSWEGEL